MKIITSDDLPVKVLADLALKEKLYHHPDWTLISCYRDILGNPDIEKSSTMLIMCNDQHETVGSVFFNEEYSGFYYWGTSIQMYIKPQFRGFGYAKTLFIALNDFLKQKDWNGVFHCGFGIDGSDDFWYKMSLLHRENPMKFNPVEMI